MAPAFVYPLRSFYGPLIICTVVSARPISIILHSDSYDINSSTPEPLITACLVSFIVLLVLLVVKLIYMKYRRLSVIRSRILQSTSPQDLSLNSRSSLLSLKATQLKAFCSKYTPSLAILVGCFGSPAWETDIESDFNVSSTKQRRTASFMYQLHRQSKQCSSKSYSVTHRSSKSSTSQAPLSHAQLSRSMSFFSFSSDHSTEDATKKLRPHLLPNTRVLAYPTKARSREIDTIVPQRYSLFIDSSMPGQLGNFCEKCDTSRSSLRSRNLCQSGRTTSGVDLGPSLRLVGASDVTAVPYSFLSAFPPSYVLSPLTGTRDSLQLSRRHSVKSTRKPVPPIPPLPSHSLLSQQPSCMSPAKLPKSLPSPARVPRFSPLLEYSPLISTGNFPAITDQATAHLSHNAPLSPSNSSKLKTSPLASPSTADYVATVGSLPHVLHPANPLVFAVQKMKRKTKHKRSSTRSRSRTAPSASPLRIMALPEDMSDRKPVRDTPTSDKENHATAISASKAINGDRIHRLMMDASNRLSPILDLTSRLDAQLDLRCPSQPLDVVSSAGSVKSTQSLARSDIEGSFSEVSSLQTPKSDRLDEVDIGMLGLDRFHWAEESEEMLKSGSSHMKNDSVALISLWEEGQWMRENQ